MVTAPVTNIAYHAERGDHNITKIEEVPKTSQIEISASTPASTSHLHQCQSSMCIYSYGTSRSINVALASCGRGDVHGMYKVD